MMTRRARMLLTWLREEAARAGAERRLRERFPAARLEPGVTVVSPERLQLGDGVLVQRGTLLHCGGFAWSGGGGAIEIGAGTTIAHFCQLWGAGTVTLGRDVSLGPGVMVISSQDRYEIDPDDADAAHVLAPVVLEDGARVYAGSIVSVGVRVGRGAVVGGNSLVLDDVPPYTLVAGTPARVIRAIDPERWRPVTRA